MDPQTTQQSDIIIDKDFLEKPFIDIPDLSIADLGFYHTPYSVGLIGLNHPNDVEAYMSKFKFLSPQVGQIVFDYSTAEFVDEKLGQAFGLTVDQKLNITRTIRDILLGDTFIGDMTQTVKITLGLDETKANDLVSMIAGELFPPAIESIKLVQRLKFPFKIQELAKIKAKGDKSQEVKLEPKQETLTQPTARPVEPRQVPTPAQQILKQQPFSQSVRPPPPQPGSRTSDSGFAAPKQPSEVSLPGKPSLQPRSPLPSVESIRPPVRTPEVEPRKPLEVQPQRPAENRPPIRPQFKIPNLGQAITKDNGGVTNQDAQKSLEQELEKVANVIDLRNKPQG